MHYFMVLKSRIPNADYLKFYGRSKIMSLAKERRSLRTVQYVGGYPALLAVTQKSVLHTSSMGLSAREHGFYTKNSVRCLLQFVVILIRRIPHVKGGIMCNF